MSIMLAIHISLGLAAILISIAAAIRPTRAKIESTIELLLGTSTSGIALLFMGASLVHVCISGLALISVSSALLVIANRRIQTVHQRI